MIMIGYKNLQSQKFILPNSALVINDLILNIHGPCHVISVLRATRKPWRDLLQI